MVSTFMTCVRRDQNIRRLDVSVDEPAAMGRIERTCYLGDNREGLFSRQRTISKCGFEVLAFHEAHRDADSEVRLEHLIDRDNVRMIETRCELRLGP